MNDNRWLNWKPGEPPIFQKSHESEPTKPTEHSIDGFEGATTGQSQEMRGSFNGSDSALTESMERLEAQQISIAIREDGAFRVVRSDVKIANGETRYLPSEMVLYVSLAAAERRLFHSFKKTFGGTAEVQP